MNMEKDNMNSDNTNNVYSCLKLEEEMEKQEEREYNEGLITRRENFVRSIVSDFNNSILTFSNSVFMLADSIKMQKPPIVINLIIDKDADPNKVKEIVNNLNN